MHTAQQLNARVATGQLDRSVARRIMIEMRIVRRIVDAGLAAGYSFDVFDGETTTLRSSKSKRTIEAALMTTDEDVLTVRGHDGRILGCINLIYGNDGYDVISDNTISLDAFLDPIMTYADQLEMGRA